MRDNVPSWYKNRKEDDVWTKVETSESVLKCYFYQK